MKDDLLKPGAFLIKTHLFIPKTVAKLSKDWFVLVLTTFDLIHNIQKGLGKFSKSFTSICTFYTLVRISNFRTLKKETFVNSEMTLFEEQQ